MDKPNKKIRKELRKLADQAYQNQLDQELYKLLQSFDDWKNKKINGFDLSDKIHEFHDGSSRDLWKRYNYSKDQLYLVAVALTDGHLQKTEISEETLKELENAIQQYRLQSQE